MPPDLDTRIRLAAFAHVRQLERERGGILAGRDLQRGFEFEGEHVALHAGHGIFKPRQMTRLLSIRTGIPERGGKFWYDDQLKAHEQLFTQPEHIDYEFQRHRTRGQDPNLAVNQLLREACERQLPVLYFLGVGVNPKRYTYSIVHLEDWDPRGRRVRIVFAHPDRIDEISGHLDAAAPADAPERRYALQECRRRVHQPVFRAALVDAYQRRCAISGLPEERLLDAAHIVPDRDADLGQPVVANGLLLSKLHHAAFDQNLIGITPDYHLKISAPLREQCDGPMLELLKDDDGRRIRLPRREQDRPNRDRLALRYEQFRTAT